LTTGGGVVVHWTSKDIDFTTEATAVRSLLSAVIESLAQRGGRSAEVTRWRERVWLGDSSVRQGVDSLVSGMALSRGVDDPIDAHLLLTDLRTLQSYFGSPRVGVIAVDDAEELFEDTELLESLVGSLEASGWTLLAAGKESCVTMMLDARSRAIRRIERVRLTPPPVDEIKVLLSDSGRYADLMPQQELKKLELSVQVGRLTGGLPLQILLVRRALVEAARASGEPMELSVSVLRRGVQLLAEVSRRRDELRRLQRVTAEELVRALKIVPYSNLTVREIATCRCLGIQSQTDSLNLDASLGDMDAHVQQVEDEIDILVRDGLIEPLGDGSRFSLIGGPSALLLYETAARELLGRETREMPFHETFLRLVGEVLTTAVVVRAVETLGGGQFLCSLRPRGLQEFPRDVLHALDTNPGAALETYVATADEQPLLAELERPGMELFIVGSILSDASDDKVARLTVWRLDEAVADTEVDDALMTASQAAEGLLDALRFHSGGVDYLRRGGRESVHLLHRVALAETCRDVLERYLDGDIDGAIGLAPANVEALREVRDHESSLLVEAFIQHGFLLTHAGRFAEACTTLSSLHPKPERWLVSWNLAIAQLGAGRRECCRRAGASGDVSLASVVGGGNRPI
jgi:hypothetical protein